MTKRSHLEDGSLLPDAKPVAGCLLLLSAPPAARRASITNQISRCIASGTYVEKADFLLWKLIFVLGWGGGGGGGGAPARGGGGGGGAGRCKLPSNCTQASA
jgi:hypothetical protein